MTILQQAFDALSDPSFWQGTIAALMLAALGAIGTRVWKVVARIIRKPQDFDISGYWIGTCKLPSYTAGDQIEIWRYTRSGQDLSLQFFAYDPNRKNAPALWRGAGILRGKMLSGYYYMPRKHSSEMGVFALQMRDNRLRGVYAQFDPDVQGEPLHVSPTNPSEFYAQHPFPDMPWRARLRMFFGRPPYATFEEVKRVHDEIAGVQRT